MMGSAVVRLGLFIIMEAAWIGALALFVDAMRAGTGSLAMLWVLAFYPLGLATEQLIGRAPARRWVRIAIRTAKFCAAAALAVLVAFPEGERPWNADGPGWLFDDVRGHRLIAFVCFGLFCWVRGTMLAGRELSTYAVALGFQIGLVVLLAVLALSSAFAIDWPGAVAISLLFVFSGLLTLWHVRADTTARRVGTGRRNPAAALVGLALVLALGLGIATAFDRSLLDQFVLLLSRIGEAIGSVFTFMFSLLPAPDPEMLEGPNGLEMTASADEPALILLPEFWRRLFAAGLFSAFGIGFAVILFTGLRALTAWLGQRRNHTPGLDINHSRHGLGDSLRSLWRAFAALVAQLGGRLGLRPREAHAEAEPFRHGYLQMERWLGRRGWPRQPSETPFEYAARLGPEWPGAGADLDMLTRAYVGARYGQPRKVPAERLRKLLRKIRRSVNKLRYREPHAEHAGHHRD